MSDYVDPAIIQGFRVKGKPFEYSKLVKQLEGLNKNSGDIYTAAPLLRAIIDTTSPLLGFITFDQVASQHTWDNSKRKNIKTLQEFRNEGDSSLHTQISSKKDYIGDLPPNHCLNTLLEECLKHGELKDLLASEKLKEDQRKPKPSVEVTLKEDVTNWQNYSAGRYMFYSFRVFLHIDNYNSSKSDYISVTMEGNAGTETWKSTYFVFDDPHNTNMKPNEPLKIEPEDIRDISVFFSDVEPRTSPQEHRFRPVGRTNIYKVLVKTKSGHEFPLEVKMEP
jgi:hypothetical protein